MSLFATSLSTTRRGASTLLPTASAVASSSSSRLPTPAPVYAQARPFSGSSTRYGKSRPGEGKDAKKAARRAERLKKDGVLDGAVANVDESYTLEEAVRVLKAVEVTRPWAAIEVHIVTSVSSHAANALRGRVFFPHNTSTKPPTLLIFAADGSASSEAARAYARANPNLKIIVGGEDLVESVAENRVSGFDKVLASPEMVGPMSRRLARSLGPKGLMPNVKRGTVADGEDEMTRAIQDAVGAVDWRGDKQAVIRAAVGRTSFTLDEVRNNLQSFIASVVERATSSNLTGGGSTARSGSPTAQGGYRIPARPQGSNAPAAVVNKVKTVLNQIHLSSTQGPGIKLKLAEAV